MSVFDIIKTIKETSSTNAKIQFVKDNISLELYDTFRLAYDPLIVFGIKVLPPIEAYSGAISFTDALEMVESKIANKNRSISHIEEITKILSLCSEDDASVIGKILLKNLDCGMSVVNFNKAIKGTTYTPIFDYPCMLASAYSEKGMGKLNIEGGVFVQEKCDGMRFNAVIEKGSINFFGRSGKPITVLCDEFKRQFFDTFNFDCMIDGELLVKRDGKILDRKTGNGILNKCVRGTVSVEESEEICCVVWDIVPIDDFRKGVCDKQYHERFDTLKGYLNQNTSKISLVESELVYTKGEITELFQRYLGEGKEGVIVKSKNNLWKNVRATDQIKLKAEEECDLRVVGYEVGTGKYEGMLGALICESECGKLQVGVGTGFTDKERKEITEESVIGKIATVGYNMLIDDKKRETKSLFLPKFIEIREDKSVADTLEQIK